MAFFSRSTSTSPTPPQGPGPSNAPALVFTLLAAASLLVLVRFGDLTPQVGGNFFFSSSDPQLQEEKQITQRFQRRDGQLIISAEGPIKSALYSIRIDELTRDIASLPGVTSVLSVTNGPKNVLDALRSPLWKRLLVADTEEATNLIVLLEEDASSGLIPRIEKILREAQRKNFVLRLSGAPYIAQVIQRNLRKDFKTFSLFAFLLFAFVILVVFRSWRILAGTLVSCLSAGVWTLLVANLLKIQIGLLTANLMTITFVLTVSHIVFLTFNWKQIIRTPSGAVTAPVAQAIRQTLTPSFWSMLTTLVGFLSLLTVAAKPLRELGISGAFGSVISMAAAYVIYPAFLLSIRHSLRDNAALEKAQEAVYQMIRRRQKAFIIGLAALTLLTLPGLRRIQSDPSIFSYFNRKGAIAKGLRYIDRNGGSSPLIIVVRTKAGEVLHSARNYARMWELQEALEKHASVGTVLSLPVLMAQAKRAPFAFFLTWGWLLEMLESPRYNEIARAFVSENRRQGIFFLRMKELGRARPRQEIVREIEEIVYENDFVPDFLGGVYVLQGHMAQLVSSSLVKGLGRLLLLFFLIGWLISKSWSTSLAMTISIGIVPSIVLGALGWARVPLDVIAAPAINVAIAMGIDAMIHMIKRWRSLRGPEYTGVFLWLAVQREMWQPVLTSVLIMALGFGIFLFSQFPPTQRFGLVIIAGTLVSGAAAFFLMPFLTLLALRATEALRRRFPRPPRQKPRP